jgi:hypothetical protein
VTYPAYNATDGNPQTRWTVDATQRGRVDSWLAVDLGSVVTIAGVRILWESAYATKYVVQTSTDAVNWTNAVSVPDAHVMTGGWVDIDGRAGLVTHESYRPIMVTATGVITGSGGPASTTVEGYPGGRTDLARAANRTMPATASGLRVNDADGYLSVFNLAEDAATNAVIWLPSTARLYRGTQFVVADGLEWMVTQPGGTARVEPPRFGVEGSAPVGTRYYVPDSQHVTITAPAGIAATVTLHSGSWSAKVRVPAGSSRDVMVPGGPSTPTTDLARCRTTFPTSPLPAGMTSPRNAVDGNPNSAWRPGSLSGRMVVDLGAVVEISAVGLTWTKGWVCPVRLESSTDGLTYTPVDLLPRPARESTTAVGLSARYVAVAVVGWRPGDAELVALSVG